MIVDVPIQYYLIVSSFIFVIGLLGLIFNRKSIISVFINVELMLLAANINLVTFSYYLKDILSQVAILFFLTIAAAEVAIGLAILIVYYRRKGNINIDDLSAISEQSSQS